MGKDNGNGLAGASSMQYSEFLQNVHSAWLTGINPYDGYYGSEYTKPTADEAKEQGLFGRLRARVLNDTAGAGWEAEFGDLNGSTPQTPYPNVANAVKARIGTPLAIHQVLPGESTSDDPIMNPYLSLISEDKYEINEGLFFDPDSALTAAAAGSLWSNVQDRMPRYDAVLNSIKEFAGWSNQGGGAAWSNPIGSSAQSILVSFLRYYLKGRELSSNQAPWVAAPASGLALPTYAGSQIYAVTTDEFPAVGALTTSAQEANLTSCNFPVYTALDGGTNITTVPTALSAYDTEDLIEQHMTAKAARSIEESATVIARITAGMEDIRAVMNTQFIGALAQLESSRLSRLDDMETELKTRAMQIRLQHAGTYSGEQRSYQQAKDQFALASNDWKLNRAAQFSQAQRMLDDALDRWEQVKSDWLLQRGVQKSAYNINVATAKDAFVTNLVVLHMQAEAAHLANTVQANNAMMDIFLKFGEAERASFLQAYDLIRLRMGLELDTTMHNVEVVRRAFTWELETFQYPMNYIASIGGSALQQRAPNWGERMLATLSSAASAGMNVGGMTGNPLLGLSAAGVTLVGSALTGRG